ncbi:MAG TPA: molybdopterin biosynthesis protein MoeB, partial [Gammaproteobacteria bacterium]|nr:molybdopterin biosynthesis protein MoeB [Gammaproteobacteria bacterium]
MNAKDQRISEIKEKIPEITPAEAKKLAASGAILLDVRESDEIAQGSPVGAIRKGRAYLELTIEQDIPEYSQHILVMCQSGIRSLFAAESLQLLGYENVSSVKGGFTQWKNEGHPFEMPATLNADAKERYSRHLLMPNVGEKGQLKLMEAKVLCIGAGGIGSPVAMYLAATGIGTLGIVDHDVVDRSNLHRQIL